MESAYAEMQGTSNLIDADTFDMFYNVENDYRINLQIDVTSSEYGRISLWRMESDAVRTSEAGVDRIRIGMVYKEYSSDYIRLRLARDNTRTWIEMARLTAFGVLSDMDATLRLLNF